MSLLLAPVVLCWGCSKQELQTALDGAKTKTKALTQSAVQAIEEELPERGSMTLETSPPTDPVGQFDLQLFVLADGRPNIVQMASYDVRQPGRVFPAILLHGTTVAGTAKSLVGITIDCDLYYQASAHAPLAISSPGESVSVTFDSFNQDNNTLNASIGTVELRTSNEQLIVVRGGQMAAVVRSGVE